MINLCHSCEDMPDDCFTENGECEFYKPKLTQAQKDEREAMLLDRQAVIQVVGYLRLYRAAAKRMLSLRYTNGECDSCALHEFESTIEDIEAGENPVVEQPIGRE